MNYDKKYLFSVFVSLNMNVSKRKVKLYLIVSYLFAKQKKKMAHNLEISVRSLTENNKCVIKRISKLYDILKRQKTHQNYQRTH